MASTTENPKQLIVIAEQGDVLLEVGTVHLRVSSEALKQTSPVFRATFQPHFMEGQQLQTTGTCKVAIEDIDVDALSTVCMVLHRHAVEIMQLPSISGLEEIARVVDRYGCCEAMYFAGTAWVKYYLDASCSITDLFSLLFFTYVADLPSAFSAVSLELVMRHPGSFEDIMIFNDEPLIQHDLAAHLDLRRVQLQRTLVRTVLVPDERFNTFTRCASGRAATKIPYVEALKAFLKAPWTETFNQESMVGIYAKVIQEPAINFAKTCTAHTAYGVKCGCSRAAWNLGVKIRKAIIQFEGDAEGLCVDCVKTGGASRISGACRFRQQGVRQNDDDSDDEE